MGIKMSSWWSAEKSLILNPADEVPNHLFGLQDAWENHEKSMLN